jgi:hypothetical protein
MTFTNNIIRTIGLALAAMLFAAVVIAVAPSAKATDLPDIGGGFEYWPDQSFDYWPDQQIDYYPDSSYEYYPDYSYDYYADSYDYSYDEQSYEQAYQDYYEEYYEEYYAAQNQQYTTPGCTSCSTPSYSYPSYPSYPTYPTYPPYVPPVTPVTPTTNNTTNNTNTCTNGSCNTNIDDHSVVNAQTTITVSQQTQTQYCPSGMSGTYPNCYWPTVQNCPTNTFGSWPNCTTSTYDVCPNIAGIQSSLMQGYYIQNGNCYQNIVTPTYPSAPQPYVTLSSVPYTGLEMGPVGTALYWGFLALWCLLAAYLIVVKRIHNSVINWVTGSRTEDVAHAAPAAPAHVAHREASAPQFAGIDPFIASQINRSR